MAAVLAVISSLKNKVVSREWVVFGEVGLSGEVRHVPYVEKRVAEAKKLGFEAAIGPKQKNSQKLPLLKTVPDVRTALNTFLEN